MLQHGPDPAKRYAAGALYEIAKSENTHDAVVSGGGIVAFVKVLEGGAAAAPAPAPAPALCLHSCRGGICGPATPSLTSEHERK